MRDSSSAPPLSSPKMVALKYAEFGAGRGTVDLHENHGRRVAGSFVRDVADRLDLIRGHWGIETQLFGDRDVTLREDASRVRKGSAPEVLARIRNVVLILLGRL